MGVEIVTFGCRLNTYESEVMRREAEAAGLAALAGRRGDLQHLRGDRRGRPPGAASRSARRGATSPDARIIVTGCAAQTDPAVLPPWPRSTSCSATRRSCSAHTYRALPDFGVNDTEKVRVNDIMSVRETAGHMVDAIEGRARAFVQVQNGCDHRCTFCIIPYRPRPFALGADGRGGRADQAAGRQRLCRGGADGRRHDQLGRRPARQPEARPAGQDDPAARCRSCARLRLSSIDSIEADDDLLDGDRRRSRG